MKGKEAIEKIGVDGGGEHQLIPKDRPEDSKAYKALRRKNSQVAHQRRTKGKKMLTQHTELPPRTNRYFLYAPSIRERATGCNM